MTEEARIEHTEDGAHAASRGWFVLNIADARWAQHDIAGRWTELEPPDGFEHYGIGIHVLEPGQPNGKYHSENVQEDFLVLSGECTLIVEDEERHLKAWDFFHCAPGTNHILVGAGDGPCAIRWPAYGGPRRSCTIRSARSPRATTRPRPRRPTRPGSPTATGSSKIGTRGSTGRCELGARAGAPGGDDR